MEEEIAQLNELLNYCRDAEKGYHTAAGRVEDPDIKSSLQSNSEQRRNFVYELEQQILILGGEPTNQPHLAAGAHRIWINLKGLINSGQAGAIAQECLRGEEEMINYYDTILNATTFSNNTRLLLTNQLQKIKKSKQELETWII